ncbi:hypothetical protein GCM10023097_59910 [Streptomyces collinus]
MHAVWGFSRRAPEVRALSSSARRLGFETASRRKGASGPSTHAPNRQTKSLDPDQWTLCAGMGPRAPRRCRSVITKTAVVHPKGDGDKKYKDEVTRSDAGSEITDQLSRRGGLG